MTSKSERSWAAKLSKSLRSSPVRPSVAMTRERLISSEDIKTLPFLRPSITLADVLQSRTAIQAPGSSHKKSALVNDKHIGKLEQLSAERLLCQDAIRPN